jgi:hypothetical protein
VLDEIRKGREERLNITKEMLPEKIRVEVLEPHTFFRNMAETVISLFPHIIAETRMEVCALVSDTELRAPSEKSQQISSPCQFPGAS